MLAFQLLSFQRYTIIEHFLEHFLAVHLISFMTSVISSILRRIGGCILHVRPVFNNLWRRLDHSFTCTLRL